jgi:hypothetical protein
MTTKTVTSTSGAEGFPLYHFGGAFLLHLSDTALSISGARQTPKRVFWEDLSHGFSG